MSKSKLTDFTKEYPSAAASADLSGDAYGEIKKISKIIDELSIKSRSPSIQAILDSIPSFGTFTEKPSAYGHIIKGNKILFTIKDNNISTIIDEITNLYVDIIDNKEQYNDAIKKWLHEIERHADYKTGPEVARDVRDTLDILINAIRASELGSTTPEAEASNPRQANAVAQLPNEAPDTYQGLRGPGAIAPPEEPPAMWCERTKTVLDAEGGKSRLQNAGEFLEDLYAPWRETLTRSWLRQHDNPLFQALYRQYGKELHPDFNFPAARESAVGLLKKGPDAVREHLGRFTGEEAVREAARLRMAETRNRQ